MCGRNRLLTFQETARNRRITPADLSRRHASTLIVHTDLRVALATAILHQLSAHLDVHSTLQSGQARAECTMLSRRDYSTGQKIHTRASFTGAMRYLAARRLTLNVYTQPVLWPRSERQQPPTSQSTCSLHDHAVNFALNSSVGLIVGMVVSITFTVFGPFRSLCTDSVQALHNRLHAVR